MGRYRGIQGAKAVRKVKEVRQQILDICAQLKMRVETCGTNWDVVRKAICSAYFANAAKMKTVFLGLP